MSMDIDDLWLRDGDERFAGFLRRLGFDHDEAAELAQKTRPPWRGWDRVVPRRLLPKDDVRKSARCSVCGRRAYGRHTWGRFGGTCTPECEGQYRLLTGEPEPPPRPERIVDPVIQGPEYEGPPMILEDEREMTDTIEKGYRA